VDQVDDDDFEVIVLTPQRHNRWAVIVPAIGLVSEIADAVGNTFRAYTMYAAQHSMQVHYDRKFGEVVSGRNSGLRSREVFPED
jgi:hypothetical protein